VYTTSSNQFQYRHHQNLDVEQIVYIDSGPLLSCDHLPIESATIRTNTSFTNRTEKKAIHTNQSQSCLGPHAPLASQNHGRQRPRYRHTNTNNASHPPNTSQHIPICLGRNVDGTTKVIIDYRVISHISSISFWVYISSVHCHHAVFVQSVIFCHYHYIRDPR